MICIYTADSKKHWREPLIEGILKTNNTVKVILSWARGLKYLKTCDLLIVCGLSKLYVRNRRPNDKGKLINYMKENNRPVLYIDTGIFSDRFNINDEDLYYTFMIDRPKLQGLGYLNDIELEDRWGTIEKSLPKFDIPKANEKQSHILVHNFIGYALETKSQTDQKESLEVLQDELTLKRHKFKTVHHPLSIKTKDRITIRQVLQDSNFCLGWQTNALCWPVLYDIPIVCYHTDNFAYDLSSQDFNKLKIVSQREKRDWLHKMSNSQFNLDEMKSGLYLDKLKEALQLNGR